MMCLHKRNIKNSVAPYKQTWFDKFMIQVQCNQCPECRKQRQNDWLVRSFYEITRRDYKSMFFVTLDFDDEHLPRYNGIPCFDSEVIKGFFKRLRYYVPKFRYLYGTDYGAALQRPHYHLMFLFDDFVPKSFFFDSIRKTWLQGKHQDVQLLRSGKSTWDCISYVCKYTTKDITFSFDGKEKDFPIRYRSRVQASSHFGFSALEEGLITYDMIKEDKPVFLPIGKNGKLFPFKVPRYYETLLTSYSVYYPEFRKSEWFKNEHGKELQEIRHNRRYLYYFQILALSLFDKIHESDSFKVFKSLYPNSPYCNMSWTDILTDCMGDGVSFENFVYNKDFYLRSKDYKLRKCYGKLIDFRYRELDWTDHLVDCPNADRYNECLHLFKLYTEELDYTKYLVASLDLVIESKNRLLNVLQNDPQKRRYLSSKGFDFNKLFDTDVLQFTLGFDDYVKQSDSPSHIRKINRFSVTKFSDFKMVRYAS